MYFVWSLWRNKGYRPSFDPSRLDKNLNKFYTLFNLRKKKTKQSKKNGKKKALKN